MTGWAAKEATDLLIMFEMIVLMLCSILFAVTFLIFPRFLFMSLLCLSQCIFFGTSLSQLSRSPAPIMVCHACVPDA
jgi:hypothetical protein